MKKLKKIILSRGRWDTVTTHKFLKDFYILVPDDELEKYKSSLHLDNFLTIPSKIIGLANVRNFVIDNFFNDEYDVVMIDDDITDFYSVCHEKAYKITDKETVDSIFNHIYLISKDLKAPFWSMNQSRDPRKFSKNDPFLLHSWIGSIVGVNQNDIKFDTHNKIRVDVDATLQAIKKFRFIWIDNRFAFYSKKDFNKGGNSLVRNYERLKREKEYLKAKWGAAVSLGTRKEKDIVRLNVKLKNSYINGEIK